MYSSLLVFHSIFRWLVLASLAYAIGNAYNGNRSGRSFTKADDSIRHWTATIAHIQLVIGFTLYFKSPVVKAFFASVKTSNLSINTAFFGVIHILLMLVSIVLITVGSALAKRRPADKEKFQTMLVWFSIALFVIFLAIPWPFSPLANRPYFRASYP